MNAGEKAEYLRVLHNDLREKEEYDLANMVAIVAICGVMGKTKELKEAMTNTYMSLFEVSDET